MTIKHLIQPRLLAITLLVISFSGCASSGGGTRKKMPEFNNSGDDYSNMHLLGTEQTLYGANEPVAGMIANNASMSFNGGVKDCYVVNIPASADMQVWSLAALYKPFAATLLSQWAGQNGKGILLDFRLENHSEEKRAEYLVTSEKSPDIPVVLLWDQQSAARANAYLAQAMDVPGVSVKRLNIK
jgi:hypothetical protein